MNKKQQRNVLNFLKGREKQIKYKFLPGYRRKAYIPMAPRPYETVAGEYVCSEETDHMYLYIGGDPC